MTDRHGPWIATAWAIGVTALAAALLWTAATMPATPRHTPTHQAPEHVHSEQHAYATLEVEHGHH